MFVIRIEPPIQASQDNNNKNIHPKKNLPTKSKPYNPQTPKPSASTKS